MAYHDTDSFQVSYSNKMTHEIIQTDENGVYLNIEDFDEQPRVILEVDNFNTKD